MTCNPCDCVNMAYQQEDTFRQSLLTILCQLKTEIEVLNTPTEVQFDRIIEVAHGSIGAGYAQAVDLADGTKTIIFDNRTNGDVAVSMDGGTTNHFEFEAGQTLTLELAKQNLKSTADIHLKDGTNPSSSGKFIIYSYR